MQVMRSGECDLFVVDVSLQVLAFVKRYRYLLSVWWCLVVVKRPSQKLIAGHQQTTLAAIAR